MIDIEKLKALALAATQGRRRWWAAKDGDHDYFQIAAGNERVAQIRILSITEADLYFTLASDPAAVLDLIAEVERLRAELAAGAAAGGNTSKDGGAGSVFESAETRMGSGFDGGAELSDGAAGKAKRPKDHNIRQLVNDLRDIATKFHATQQLRARISGAVGQFIDSSYEDGAAGTVEKDATHSNVEALPSVAIHVNGIWYMPYSRSSAGAAIEAHNKAGKEQG